MVQSKDNHQRSQKLKMEEEEQENKSTNTGNNVIKANKIMLSHYKQKHMYMYITVQLRVVPFNSVHNSIPQWLCL